MKFTVSKVIQGEAKHIEVCVDTCETSHMNIQDARELAREMLYAVEALLEAAELPEMSHACSDRAYELNEYI